MSRRNWKSAAVAVGAVLLVAGCGAGGGGDDDAVPGAEQQAAAEQDGPGSDSDPSAGESEGPGASGEKPGEKSGAEAEGPDLSGIPDPVAVVNGTEISRDEFVSVFEGQYQQMSMQAQMTGQPVDEEQLKKIASDGLVGTVLLEQEAVKRGLEVSDAEIDAELEKFAETNQVSPDEFVAAMGEQGLDRQGVLDQIAKQLRVDKLMVDEFGEPEITDQQVEEAYATIAEQQASAGGQPGAGMQGGGQVPPLEEVRDQVAEQLRAEKQAANMETMSQKLREGADVTVHI